MATKFKITISIKDGVLLPRPEVMWFDCNLVTPVGVQVIRQYNANECIEARKAYIFVQGGRRFGSFDFQTLQQFIDHRNNNCVEDECCYLTYNGCILTINGNRISYN